MITKLQKEELEKIKPQNYRVKVQKHLLNNGYKFSLETIQKVYIGKRKNLTIVKAIITVFNEHRKEQELVRAEINTIIKQIEDTANS